MVRVGSPEHRGPGSVVLVVLATDVEVVTVTATVVLVLLAIDVDVVGTVDVVGRAGPSTWHVLTHSPATTFRGPQPSQADALVSKKQATTSPSLVMAHACSQAAGSPSNRRHGPGPAPPNEPANAVRDGSPSQPGPGAAGMLATARHAASHRPSSGGSHSSSPTTCPSPQTATAQDSRPSPLQHALHALKPTSRPRHSFLFTLNASRTPLLQGLSFPHSFLCAVNDALKFCSHAFFCA
jgi:hypothetical protein